MLQTEHRVGPTWIRPAGFTVCLDRSVLFKSEFVWGKSGEFPSLRLAESLS